ncbi:hypothetical protein ABZ468_08360 [Streptomyces sp. NPDC005708]|uniref:hypothetical protein n=1 Tax=Streptomyces sp. NPDC005708 TaxID=3154564 RepID=UPI0033EC37FB
MANLRGLLTVPVGAVADGQTPEQAAHQVLRGAPDGLPSLRYLVLDRVQMRRRRVITHVLATEPMTREAVTSLAYRDPRATICVLPTRQIIDQASPQARLRILVGLQALATGVTSYIEGDVVQWGPPADAGLPQALPAAESPDVDHLDLDREESGALVGSIIESGDQPITAANAPTAEAPSGPSLSESSAGRRRAQSVGAP